MEYRVPVVHKVFGYVTVNAKNRKALLKKLKDDRFVEDMPLPVNADYIEDSYVIDFEGEFSDENEYFFFDE